MVEEMGINCVVEWFCIFDFKFVFVGMFFMDNFKNVWFFINYFIFIGMGKVIEDMREYF